MDDKALLTRLVDQAIVNKMLIAHDAADSCGLMLNDVKDMAWFRAELEVLIKRYNMEVY